MATILIADDCLANREFLVALLGHRHRVIEASDGAEALELVRSARPDLVISDVLMPRRDGYEFVRQVRSDSAIAHTPVIFYTAAYHDHRARALAQQCGVTCVLTKPTEPEQILKAIDGILGYAPALPTSPTL